MAKQEKKPKEFLGELKSIQKSENPISKLSSVYFIYGEEIYVSERATQRIKKIIAQANGSIDRVILGNVKINDWLTDLYDIPMFSTTRFVIASNISDLKADEIEQLLEYTKSPSPDVYLLLLSDILDKRKKNILKLLDYSVSCNAKHPADNELAIWIKGFAADKGKSIEATAIEFLKNRFGNNLAILEKEVEKISLYISNKPTIERKDVEFMTSGISGCSVFDLFPIIADRNKKAATGILYKLLNTGENHLSLLSLLTGRIKKLLLGNDLISSGNASDSMLAEKTGVHPYYVGSFKRELKQYKREDLKSMYKTCIDIDSKLKSSRINKDDILLKGLLSLMEHK